LRVKASQPVLLYSFELGEIGGPLAYVLNSCMVSGRYQDWIGLIGTYHLLRLSECPGWMGERRFGPEKR